MLAMDADEIPPGILVITGVSGAAAAAAKQELRRMRGKDHKVRVVTSPDPSATGARWVEMRHTAKDVDFVNVVREIRRTIWRVFGVLPVEMGASEDVPRSVGQVQLDVSSSHLISPILELIEGKLNARIIPLILGASANLVNFRFDREFKLSTSEQKEKSDYLRTLVSSGIMTRNEARVQIDLPPIRGGDVVLIETPLGPLPLAAVVQGAAVPSDANFDPDADPVDDDGSPSTGSDGEVLDPTAGGPSDDDDAPGEVDPMLSIRRKLAEGGLQGCVRSTSPGSVIRSVSTSESSIRCMQTPRRKSWRSSNGTTAKNRSTTKPPPTWRSNSASFWTNWRFFGAFRRVAFTAKPDGSAEMAR